MDLRVLARIVGFSLADGNLYFNPKNRYYEVSFSLGEEADVEELRKDLAQLGFVPRVREESKTIVIGGRSFKLHAFRAKCASQGLFNLLTLFGAVQGNKGNMQYSVPDWILSGTAEVQRAFLAGYLGGDGAKVTIRVVPRKNKLPYNHICINDIELYKNVEIASSGVIFAYQLKWLLERLGVKVRRIFCKGRFPRKDGSYSTSIHVAIASTVESALAYCTLGFAYCNQKRAATQPVYAFLQELSARRAQWGESHAHALNLYNRGLSIKEVADKLGLSYDVVFGWIRYNKKPTVKKHYLKFDTWVKSYAANKC